MLRFPRADGGRTPSRACRGHDVTAQVHEFDPVTFAELNPAYLVTESQDKIVDLEFRPAGAQGARIGQANPPRESMPVLKRDHRHGERSV